MYRLTTHRPAMYIALIGIAALTIAAGLFTYGNASALTTSGATSTGAYNVMIMTHLCNTSIKNSNDFANMESGKSPVRAIAEDVLACPTTGLLGTTAASGTISAPRMTFDFSVQSDTQSRTLAGNGTFMPTKICESDVGLDLNGDNVASSSTCLDISDYNIPVTSGSSTILHVMQTMAPAGYHFGVLRFTPVALDNNNDASNLAYLDPNSGNIDLNMVPDKDGMVMLHVYEFANATSTGTGTSTGSGGGTGTSTGSGGGSGSGTTTNSGGGNGSLLDLGAAIQQFVNSITTQFASSLGLPGTSSSSNTSSNSSSSSNSTSSNNSTSSTNINSMTDMLRTDFSGF